MMGVLSNTQFLWLTTRTFMFLVGMYTLVWIWIFLQFWRRNVSLREFLKHQFTWGIIARNLTIVLTLAVALILELESKIILAGHSDASIAVVYSRSPVLVMLHFAVLLGIVVWCIYVDITLFLGADDFVSSVLS